MSLNKGASGSQNYICLDKVPDSESRPFWSVIIPTYNCARYLRETLKSVLIQDPGPKMMEIIVVDDYSTEDDPRDVVEELGKDRVNFIRQKENVGKVRNYETGLLTSKGQVIHLLHGDDRIHPGFYGTMEKLLIDNPEAKAAFCRSLYIDERSRWTGLTGMLQNEDGIVEDMLDRLYVGQQVQTPSMVVKREVYETIGTFDRRLNAMEDWEMWTRIANNFPIAFSNLVLAEYRTHNNNATVQTFIDGTALEIHEKVYRIIDEYVDDDVKSMLRKKRNKFQSEFLYTSYLQLKEVLPKSLIKKIKNRIFHLDPNLRTFTKLLIR